MPLRRVRLHWALLIVLGLIGVLAFDTSSALARVGTTSSSAPVAVICNAADTWDVNSPITFDGSCSSNPNGRPLQYHWDFNYDGVQFRPSFDSNGFEYSGAVVTLPGGFPTYTESANGTPNGVSHPVALQVYDPSDFQSSITAFNVTVKPPPHAPHVVVARSLVGVVNMPVQFDASQSYDVDSDPLTYAWDFQNNGLFADATGATPSFTFSAPGTYTVAVKVTDHPDQNANPYNAASLSSTADITVTIGATTVPVPSAGGPYTIAQGTTIRLDATGSTEPGGLPMTYAWDLDNDGVLAIPPAQHRASASRLMLHAGRSTRSVFR